MPRRKKETTEHKDLTPREKLESVIAAGIQSDSLEVLHEQLKLLGIVMGQRVLLQSLLDPSVAAKDKVTAAKTLVSMVKENPEEIAERIRSSAFCGLTAEQLETIIEKVGVTGNPEDLSSLDLESLVQKVKDS